MLIKNLFERDIFRPINGVVKADQLDDSSVWQELDEFVITKELDQHFRKFIDWYLQAVDQGKILFRRSFRSLMVTPEYSGAHSPPGAI